MTKPQQHVPSTMLRLCRLLFLQLPLYATLALLLLSYGLQALYQGPLTQLLKSFHLPEDDDPLGLYEALQPDITYYNRQCHLDDISTRDANDLLIESNMPPHQRKDIMMTHGAVVMKNILSTNTSSVLRSYLEKRHDVFLKNDLKLPWNELFWDGGDGSRLSLGIGPEDDPIIAQALHEVGQNTELEKTLTAILGPNPAIVEVSTLNTMVGASHQGIHTDSDYFGSSVMYARTFLHSYTMFVALQDTTPQMGATTLCPGTHFCANEDLEAVCMERDEHGERNSFEASSNGKTHQGGELLQGDAMMFNQNVWHRGPKNKDPERPFTRAMFILTFVSQRPLGDVRQQGWGTYYYMRHSMWGQAFDDLKKDGMSNLPLRFLKAYGLYTTPSSSRPGHSPMPWLEHWARQMANDMDFFTRNDLSEFKEMLETSKYFPKQLMGNPKTKNWNTYLLEMLHNATFYAIMIYGGVLLVYLIVHMLGYAMRLMSTTSKPKSDSKSTSNKPNVVGDVVGFVGGLIIGHAVMLGIFAAISYYILYCAPLFQRINSGYIFRTPFPNLPRGVTPVDVLEGRITTAPERMDVLVGTRFDAEYLASMNDMLDYHPGNKEWRRMVRETAGFPMVDVASDVLVNQVTSSSKPYQGVLRRFLLQDYATGYWTVMDKKEATREAKRALMMEEKPMLKTLASHWKQVLADARFGMLRKTALARTWIPKTVDAWMDKVIFAEPKDTATETCSAILKSTALSAGPTPWSSMTRLDAVPSKPSSFRAHLEEMKEGIITLKLGDIVQVKASPGRDHWLAKILEIHDFDQVVVRPVGLHDRIRMNTASFQVYRPVEQGDWVWVAPEQGFEDPDNWELSQVAMVHPFGNIDARIGGALDDELEDEDGYNGIETVNPSEFYLSEDDLPDFRLDYV